MVKRKRKMTEEQRQAAVERLAKAREKRLRDNPPAYKSIHPDVLVLDDTNPLSMKSVKSWIKSNKTQLAAARREKTLKTKGAIVKVESIRGYIRSMETYLKEGVWTDLFYGEFQENKMGWVCKNMAYDKNGLAKRVEGVYYPDMGCIYTREMQKEDYAKRG